MGMVANYQYLSDENLNKLKSFDVKSGEDIFDVELLEDDVELWNEEAEDLLDIDKMWDVLHFVLTGLRSTKAKENNPLSEAIIGVTYIDGTDNYISYIEKTRISDILSALESFDIDKALDSFSIEKCREADLYPNIWNHDYESDEIDEIKECIFSSFKDMKEFYKSILETNGNVLVTIY